MPGWRGPYQFGDSRCDNVKFGSTCADKKGRQGTCERNPNPHAHYQSVDGEIGVACDCVIEVEENCPGEWVINPDPSGPPFILEERCENDSAEKYGNGSAESYNSSDYSTTSSSGQSLMDILRNMP